MEHFFTKIVYSNMKIFIFDILLCFSYNIIKPDTTYDGNKLTAWFLLISHDKDVN